MVYTEVIGFEAPESLPAGADVTVRVQLRNADTVPGYVEYIIDGNPDQPDRYVTVEAGGSYPTSVPPGGTIWLDVYFRYFKMPAWDFVLTARNYDKTSYITRTIRLQVGVPTTLTISAPDAVAAGETFTVSGILYETKTKVPIPGQPINVSYDGRFIGGATTGVDGDYLLEASIPEPGTWTLKAEFPGTATYAAASSRARMAVAVSPAVHIVAIAIPLAVGATLITLAIRG